MRLKSDAPAPASDWDVRLLLSVPATPVPDLASFCVTVRQALDVRVLAFSVSVVVLEVKWVRGNVAARGF